MVLQPLKSTVRFCAPTSRYFPTKKRSNKRTRPRNYAEEEYLAKCLVKLARGSTEVIKRPASVTDKYPTSLEEVKKDQEPENLSNVHTCNVCNRSFSSYQALGGHKASHRTKTPVVKVEEQQNLKKVRSLGKGHFCSRCSKTFTTGQALGGHMRKHYEGVVGSPKNRSSDGAKSHSNEGVTAGFDLNVALPAVDDIDLYCHEAESAFM